MTLQDILLQQLANGLILGSFYALVALGYTMVYGIIKLLNFAHGDLYMIGAFLGFLVLSVLSPLIGDSWVGIMCSMVLSMIAVGLLGVLIQRIAYQPMLSAPRLSILITALAVSMILSNGVLAFTDGEYLAFSTDLGYEGLEFGNVFITYTQMVLVGAAALLMSALYLFVHRTMYGKAMRAIAIDKDACRLMGIHVNRIIALTFFIGTSLAASAGIMAGAYYGSIHFFMGFVIGLKAFTAAVIGGIGSIPGAMLGGLLLGLLESFGTQIPFIGTEWKDVFSFGILILLLVFKPTGILGRTEIERM
ncbi:MAG: branched-chain amino acid ABC transporter permease [Desulfofustis sp.]|nr:branched-chain amino acid ABC transporter permease [Desulfofustis sp.]MBT8347821.1 branched-chain amino acid ABC transporter permease [Desulfofustis sp.]NNF47437.1 branched-chain amino acid ABC transporter permease [Desulfofustis sp.]NNK13474.1 branched-chain amino acid ABC transporter permease [Desulfofustis sp.]NNK56315.1 branched-chain amino acid ABC transporter permease [Desulfofustis sp.]